MSFLLKLGDVGEANYGSRHILKANKTKQNGKFGIFPRAAGDRITLLNKQTNNNNSNKRPAVRPPAKHTVSH